MENDNTNNTISKKDYISGMLTGILITTFIAACFVCGKIIYDSNHRGATVRVTQTQQIQEETENVVSLTGNVKNDIDSSGDTILDDADTISKIITLEDMIDLYYIDEIDDDVLRQGIYDGIMDSLNDPYADYYTAEEFLELTNSTQGIYYGIGAYLQKDNSTLYPRVTGIIKNSPAEQTDLCVEDYIVEVDGTDVFDMDLEDVVKLIKGPENTDVVLKVVRQVTGQELEITITRGVVESPTVETEMYDGGIAYIQITEFDSVTVDQFKEALDNARSNGMKSLILDLRGNPGGSLTAVVQIADYLLPAGLVVYTEDKYGEKVEYSSSGRHEIDVPMVVLVDGGSASAAEILAGAIKDYKVGKLVGTTTFGKGIVQRIVPLEDGSAIKLTVSHYYTPLGNDIHKVGIEPDEVLKFDSKAYIENRDNDNQLERALEILREN